jgi:predicted transport protein
LWFNREIIGLIKRKHKALKKYKHSRAIEDYICFKRLRSEVKTKIKAAYRNFIVNMNDKIKTNPKCFGDI